MRHDGFDFSGLWENKTPERTEFVYLLRWPDETTTPEQWQAFMADEEWTPIKRETSAEHGDLVGKIAEKTMVLTDDSAAV